MSAEHESVRRTGPETKRAAQLVAIDLFTTQGYAATSLRQIAGALGIQKASLYYHFPNKQAILRSLFDQRVSEIDQLRVWLREQPRTPELLETAVLRWVSSFSTDKLRGIRFLRANPLLAQMTSGDGERIGANLEALVEDLLSLLPSATFEVTLLLRMSVLSINAAVEAAANTAISDESIVRAASRAARALLRDLSAGSR